MALSFQSDDDLRAFVLQLLRGSDQAKLIRQLQGATDAGIVSFSFSAATVVTVTGIVHGLGVVPAVVAITAHGSAGGVVYDARNEGAKTFDLRAVAPSAITGTVQAWWIAAKP